MARENSNITKRVLMSEVLMEDMQKVTIKGLAYECKSLSEELGIPNVVFNKVNKSTIKQATEAIDKKEIVDTYKYKFKNPVINSD